MAKTKSIKAGSVRIIGGEWRGRKLDFPESDGLRPTGDRIRETLFNWLQMHLGSARCLDLFAGSGALGIEAASRGAAAVDMIELDSKVAQQIQQNVIKLNAQQCHVHKMSAEQFLNQAGEPYQIVFIDPPFQLNLWGKVIQQLVTKDLLSDAARIYIEMPKRSIPFEIPEQWQLLREKLAGDVKYALYEHISGDKHGEHNGDLSRNL